MSPHDLQLLPPCCSSLEFVGHKLDMLLLEDISHVEKLLYFINSVQEGFNIKVLTEGKNLDLHLIFVRTWLIPSPILIRKRKSPFPVRNRICHPSRASLISHPSVVDLIFEVVFLIEGGVEFLLIGKIFVWKIP